MENHQFHFRGTFNHRVTHELLVAGKITTTEFALLAVIDSLNGPDGCYASKAYLANCVHVLPRHVQKMVARLIRLGLIYQDGMFRSRGRNCRVLRTGQGGSHIWLPDGAINGSLSKDSRNNTRSASGRRERKEEELGFFEVDETPIQKNKPRQSDHEMARELRSAIQVKGVHLARRWSESAWAKEMFRIRIELANDQRLTNVFRWYLKNVGRPYTPVALSAKAFRAKFAAIEAAMKRDKDALAEQVTVGPEAARLVKYYDGLGWPKGTKARLGPATQRTLNALKEFRDRLKANALVQPALEKRVARILSYLKHGYTITWFRLVFDRYGTWDKWSGDIDTMVWDPNHKLFTEQARGWMREYTGDPKDWDKLLEALR